MAIQGTNDPDVLAGGSGSDDLNGLDGADTLYGGGAADTLTDLSSGNLIWGDRYADAPHDRADAGDDTIRAGLGNTVHAGGGNDSVLGLGSDTLDGGLGNDTLVALSGTNWVVGGLGADVIRATGTIFTDDNDATTPLEGGDRVVASYADRIVHGVYDVQDFKPGAGGDVLSLHEVFADLAAAGYDGLNPLLDQQRFALDGTRVVQSSAGVLGGNGWLRLRQQGADTLVEVDATGGLDGSVYQTVVILRGVALGSLQQHNFDPPFRLDGAVVHADLDGTPGNDNFFVLDGNDTVRAGAGDDLVRSTYGNDSVDGGLGSDTLYGGWGNDTLRSGASSAGVDFLHGEGGDDLLQGDSRMVADGGSGNDQLLGSDGDDELRGGSGKDTLAGGAGSDYLFGDAQDDMLDGGTGRDWLSGGDGDDRLWSGVTGVSFGTSRTDVRFTVTDTDVLGDSLSGGSGADTLVSGAGDDTLNGGDGQLVAFAGAGADLVIADGSGHHVDAGTGDDTLSVGGSSTLIGGEGHDRIAVRDAGNAVQAGSGNDVVAFESSPAIHGTGVAALGSGADTVALSLRSRELGRAAAQVSDFKVAEGDRIDLDPVLGRLWELGYDYANPFTQGWVRLVAAGTDTLVQVDTTGSANAGQWLDIARLSGVSPAALDQPSFVWSIDPQGDLLARRLAGTGGADTLHGGDAGDSLSGLGGADWLDGAFGGADTLLGGEGADTLFGFSGADSLDGGDGDDVAFGGYGNDVIDGGAGDDAAVFLQTYKGRAYQAAGLSGEEGDDTVSGGDGHDVIDGGTGNDLLRGDAGNDRLLADDAPRAGQTDHDSLSGGSGNDTLDAGHGNDTLRGDAGSDALAFDRDDRDRGSAWTVLLDGGADADTLLLHSTRNSTLLGGDGDDVITLHGAAAARADGGGGNDRIDAGAADADLRGGGLRWRNDDATLLGGAGDDTLLASGERLVIDGGAGSDLIDLAAYDNAWGLVRTGSGSDTVRLSLRSAEAAHAPPVIADFTPGPGGDRLDVSAVLGRLAEGGYDYGNPFAGGWLRLQPLDGNLLLQADLNGPAGGGQWITVVVLQGVPPGALDLGANFIPPLGGDGELITGTAGHDALTDTLPVVGVRTTGGNDTVYGLAGNDTLDGGSGGADRLFGGDDDDLLFGFDGADSLDGGAGRDVVLGGFGDDTVLGGAGDDGGTSDAWHYRGTYKGRVLDAVGLNGEEGNDWIDGGDGRDLIDGGNGNDTLFGGAEADVINAANATPGVGDADSASGGLGDDTIQGGGGNDTLRGDAGADFIEFDRTATERAANRVVLLDGGADADKLLLWHTSASTVLGGTGDDTLQARGSTGALLDGGDGHDLIDASNRSGGLSQPVWVNDAATIRGGGGDDTILASGARLRIEGGAGRDLIDLAISEGASATVATGDGADTVRLSLLSVEGGFALPAITDFNLGADPDRLDLAPVLGRLWALGYDYANPFTGGWLRLTASNGDTLLQADLSGPGNGGQWLTLALLRNTAPLGFSADNFVYQIAPTGFAAGQFVNGSERADALAGADGHDSIAGLGDNDLLDGAFGGRDTLRGGEGDDTLFGFSDADSLDGGLGADVVLGGYGNDTILGGSDDDAAPYKATYKGRAYEVWGLNGEQGDDSIDGGDGNDRIDGGSGNDTLLGGTGNDLIAADGGSPAETRDADSVLGGDGADTLHGGWGNDTLRGEAGNDTLLFDRNQQERSLPRSALLDGGADNDTLRLSFTRGSTLLGGSGDDLLTVQGSLSARVDGGEGDDLLDAALGAGHANDASWENDAATLVGGLGNDTIRAAGEALVIDAGAGDDLVDLAVDERAAATVTTGTGRDTVRLSLASVIDRGYAPAVITDFSTGASGDRLDLSPVLGRLWALGYDYGNPFTGGWLRLVQSGADTQLQADLNGPVDGAQWTTVALLRGTQATAFTRDNFVDRIAPAGDTAPRTADGTLAPDTLVGADGADSLAGAGDDDLLDGAFGGADTLRGAEGNDLLFGFDGGDLLDGGLGNDVVFGGFGNDTIQGGSGNDAGWFSGTYKGRAYNQAGLNGEEGNDFIDGGDGDDRIDGGRGGDTLLGGAGADVIKTGTDSDRDSVSGGDGADDINGGSGSNSDGADTLRGDAGNDYIFYLGGKGGLVDGGADHDTLVLLASDSTVLGGAGNDTVSVPMNGARLSVDLGDGDDQLTGSGDASTVLGGLGNDTIDFAGTALAIDAGAGRDLIVLSSGNGGSGRISTGADADVVRLAWRAPGELRPAPVLTDFTAGAGGDRLDLSAVLARLPLSAGADPFASGHLRLTPAGSGTLLELDADAAGNGARYVALALLQGVAPGSLTAANFVQALAPRVGTNPAAPTAQDDKTVLLLEDAAATPLGLTAPSDPDGGMPTIRIDALPSPSLGMLTLADGSAVASGQALSAAQLTGLRFTPQAHQNGALGGFAYSVMDDEGSVITRQVQFQATPVNDAPTLTNLFERTFLDSGDQPFTLDLDDLGHDIEDDAQLAFGVTLASGQPLPSWLRYDAATHVLSGTAPYATTGAWTLAIRVTDPQGASATGSFVLRSSPGTFRFGTEAADTLLGGSGHDGLYGYGAADRIEGRTGNDTLFGVDGDDLLLGGEGSDRLEGGQGADTLDGGSGADQMIGGAGADTYWVDNVSDGVDESSAVAGETDTVRSSVSWTLGLNLENLVLTGTAAVSGTGNGAANALTGNAAANVLDGGAGLDTLSGGAGNDTYVVDSVLDKVVETSTLAAETDTVRSSVSWTLGANLEHLVLLGSAAINGTGNTLANHITGNAAANGLNGGAGADTLSGGAGNDTLNGGTGDDALAGGSGSDTFVVDSLLDKVTEDAGAAGDIDTVQSTVTWVLGANLENLALTGIAAVNGTGNAGHNLVTGNGAANVLSGGAGNDTLDGGLGHDSLAGGTGNDLLAGGVGNDTLAGGAGQDTFRFNAAPNAASNVDHLTDFLAVDDRLEFDDAVFTRLGAVGAVKAGAFVLGTKALDADDRLIYMQSTGQLLYDADGSGAGAAVLVARLAAGTTLTLGDLFVV
ncbi:putative Ig domain-containing protein [Azohydromonas aeria]|uniref:putative Ig domain-containing protein n=1 Tax=Azohydromonas aeria TaxID=2590212 RepID=UPI0012F81E5E|nr:putative Ig domain-containing protein [Azohydromonas aeria]